LSRIPLQIAAGLFVLLAGLIVVYAGIAASGAQPVAQQVVPAPSPTQVVEVPPPTLEGVDPAVQRVLYSTGRAEAFRADELTQLPQEVARVLASYGATITVAVEVEGGR
jgi:hypothetical protein